MVMSGYCQRVFKFQGAIGEVDSQQLTFPNARRLQCLAFAGLAKVPRFEFCVLYSLAGETAF